MSGRDVQSIVAELQQKVNAQLGLPAGYHLVYGGSFENMNAAKERLSIVVPVALLLIFLLLYFAFHSVKQGLLIYTAVPLSAMGGIFALAIRDMPFSISAGVGFIALFGVAVLNGILLVSEFNRLKKEGWHDVRRIVVHATQSKLRAVLMTALVPSLGFIPMAISTGAGGAVQKPLATVVIGGLIVSTLLTLFVLPVLYMIFEKGFRYNRGKMKRVAIAGLLIFMSSLSSAQTPATLDELLRMAREKNKDIQAAALSEDYYEALVPSAFDPGHANVTYEQGKLNSTYLDNRFTVGQSIQFPTVYRRQKTLNQSNVRVSRDQTQYVSLQIQTDIKRLFYGLLVLEYQQQALAEADSLYANFLQKAENRLRLGEGDLLEKTAAENQRMQIATQLAMLQRDKEIDQRRLQYLTGSSEFIDPVADSILYISATPVVASDTAVANHPLVQLQQSLIVQGKAALQLEKSKLRPSLTFGYANASFSGWQTTPSGDHLFTRSDRFQSGVFGIGVPLFHSAQTARIKASRLQVKQREKELEAVNANLQSELSAAIRAFLYNQRLINQYHNTLLPNADIIIQTASNRLQSGEINYLDWVLLVNQAIDIRAQYFQVVEQFNASAFEIEKLQGIIR